jgi:hypothetical protein
MTLHLRPEDGPVQGPKYVVFSLNKRLLQILQLCFDLPYIFPHLHILSTTGMPQLKITKDLIGKFKIHRLGYLGTYGFTVFKLPARKGSEAAD